MDDTEVCYQVVWYPGFLLSWLEELSDWTTKHSEPQYEEQILYAAATLEHGAPELSSQRKFSHLYNLESCKFF